ncbi:MAG TPA: CDP-glycerol glycerophosphotransferase family protein, partial [Chondromyces sp.]|nr:CDP-glycerol glycerophosphotransferase family protein [Chondromyces sp.]
TSRYILIDNYYGFLAAVDFKEGVQCIQLWHASGALKKFGLEDESVKYRSPKAKQRFLRVYSKFHKVVAGSDAMAAIFIKSFNLKEEQILTTGVPRTDLFFNEKEVQKARQALARQHQAIEDKKVILYVPTYRDHESDHWVVQLDLEKMLKKLGKDHILLLRLHPVIQNTVVLSQQYPDFIIDVSSDQYEINELLLIADYLITDYSSVPVEFSLLRKPMIFFVYDLEEYKQTRGVAEGFEHSLPGPIVRDTDSIIECIYTNRFDLTAISRYAQLWNKYSKGYSSYYLVRYMFPEKILKNEERSTLS